MKNIVLVVSSIFFGLLTLTIVMTIYGDMNRSMELQSNVPSLIEEALEHDLLSQGYKNDELELFIADFAKQLAVSWENQSDMQIDVLQYNPEQGILSLRVTALYRNPYGTVGKVACERTVILNRMQE